MKCAECGSEFNQTCHTQKMCGDECRRQRINRMNASYARSHPEWAKHSRRNYKAKPYVHCCDCDEPILNLYGIHYIKKGIIRCAKCQFEPLPYLDRKSWHRAARGYVVPVSEAAKERVIFAPPRVGLWPETLAEYELPFFGDRYSEILSLRYEEGLTLEQIGAQFQVTKERVRQIIKKQLRRFRTIIDATDSIRSGPPATRSSPAVNPQS